MAARSTKRSTAKKRPERKVLDNGLAVDGPEFEKSVENAVAGIAVSEEARRVWSWLGADEVELPPLGQSMADDLAVEEPDTQFTIDQLHPRGGNSLAVAEKKAGKTTLALNLMRALADGEPFLDHFGIEPLEGRVAFFNYELHAVMFRRWVRDLGIENMEKIAPPLHLRGRTLALWQPEVMKRLGEWLRRYEVEFLIIDPAARAWSGLVKNENDNAEVGQFTDALDALKREGEVRDLLLLTHTGRARHEEGQEQARGAARLEDWMDAGWYLTKDGEGQRALRAMGRDVELEAVELSYDDAMRRQSTTGRTRADRRNSDGALSALAALSNWSGEKAPNTTELADAMEGDRNKRNRYILEAVKQELIRRKKDGRSERCYMTKEGRKRLMGRVERAA